MSSWLGAHTSEADLLAVRTGLAEPLAQLRADTGRECPGRTATIIEARMAQMIAGEGGLEPFGELDPGEQVVVALAEQFMLDAHGVDGAQMARLGEHFSPAEQIAIMFQLAFTDGFTKLRRVMGLPVTTTTVIAPSPSSSQPSSSQPSSSRSSSSRSSSSQPSSKGDL